jgi:hypothetical protein
MAPFPRPVVCQQRVNGMTPKPNNSPTLVAGGAAFRQSVSRCGGRMARWQKSIRLTARTKIGGDA